MIKIQLNSQLNLKLFVLGVHSDNDEGGLEDSIWGIFSSLVNAKEAADRVVIGITNERLRWKKSGGNHKAELYKGYFWYIHPAKLDQIVK